MEALPHITADSDMEALPHIADLDMEALPHIADLDMEALPLIHSGPLWGRVL